MCVGYHYTPATTWERIEVEGLRPYPIPPQQMPLQGYHGDCHMGIFVFCDPPANERDLLGTLILNMIKRGGLDIVLVRCQYPESTSFVEIAKANGDIADLLHRGWLAVDRGFDRQEETYHDIPYDIVMEPIPPQDCELLGTFGIRSLSGDWTTLSEYLLTTEELKEEVVNV